MKPASQTVATAEQMYMQTRLSQGKVNETWVKGILYTSLDAEITNHTHPHTRTLQSSPTAMVQILTYSKAWSCTCNDSQQRVG